jgi:hypothetical protein
VDLIIAGSNPGVMDFFFEICIIPNSTSRNEHDTRRKEKTNDGSVCLARSLRARNERDSSSPDHCERETRETAPRPMTASEERERQLLAREKRDSSSPDHCKRGTRETALRLITASEKRERQLLARSLRARNERDSSLREKRETAARQITASEERERQLLA